MSIDAVSASADRQSLPGVLGAVTLFLADLVEASERHRAALSSHAPRHKARKTEWRRQIEAALTPSQCRYLRLRIDNPGVQDREIASMMGCTPQNVSALRKQMIARIHDDEALTASILAYYRDRER